MSLIEEAPLGETVAERSVAIPKHLKGIARFLRYAGPAIVVSVGYMDPGNWGTDIGAGSQYEFKLLWSVVLAGLAAIYLQNLSAKLGVAGGMDLATACRLNYSKTWKWILWAGAQLAIVACDLAEVIGSAVALNLLFHIPLLIGVFVTAADVLLILSLEKFGFRKLEAIVLGLVVTIGFCFLFQLAISRPDWHAAALGAVTPWIGTQDALILVVGILGATVMPHNLYLHSALVKTRAFDHTGDALKMNRLDTYIALGVATFVNCAILIVAASTFYRHGHHEVSELQDAYGLLKPLLGGFAPAAFAIGLLAAGQSSTITGTLAGQVVMEGFLGLKIEPWLQRLLTRSLAVIPAALFIAIQGGSNTVQLLVISQVVLSMQLPFAVFPLVWMTGSKKIMGDHASKPAAQAIGLFLGFVILALNGLLLYLTFTGKA